MNRHDDILARLRAATGPDRECDIRIDHMMRRRGISWGYGDDYGGSEPPVVDLWSAEKWAVVAKEAAERHPRYTSSIDAAMALVAELLPDASISVCRLPDGAGYAWINDPVRQLHQRGATPAIAVLIAGIEALKAKEAA